MKILVSGGFGYIGSFLTSYLLDRGYTIGVLSKKIPDSMKEFSKRVEFYPADIEKPILLNLLEDFDAAIHLAASNDIESRRNAKHALVTTTFGTRNFLDFCIRNTIKKIIYFSTFQVYGTSHGFIDETSTINCLNDYALTHYFAEEYVKLYSRLYGIHYIIVRPTNIFGRPVVVDIDRWSLVPNCFCLDAFRNARITVSSSGKQFRDFISLFDISRAIELLLQKFDTARGRTFNLASGRSQSVLSVAHLVKKKYEKKFGKKCTLDIKSGNSKEEGGRIYVNTDQLKKLGFKLSAVDSLEKEVEEIFKLLKRTSVKQ